MGRARSIEAKRERREHILAAAVDLLSQEPYERLTMASVAAAAGLAKGTPYLYWRTKEELFLAALSDEYAAFWVALREALGRVEITPAGAVPSAIARAITDEVVARPRFVSLVALAHVVLERHAPVDAVIAFKRGIVAGGVEVAAALCERMPGLSPERAARFLMRMHGVIVALRQMCDLPEHVSKALAEPDLAFMRMEFESDLYDLVLDLLVAARARSVDV